MFEETFSAELAKHTGSNVEVTTDNNLIEGLLSTVTDNLVLVIEVNTGYGDNTKMYVPLQSINYVRFPQTA